MKTLQILIFCCIITLGISSNVDDDKMPRIGIIGGGIGGTSCAYFLRSLFKESVKIDLFEAEKIGGRLSIVNFSQNKYEEGGSIIHSRNKYMVNFAQLFNLSKRADSGGYFGLYNGKDFVFSESEWKIVTAASMFYRYGLGFVKLSNYIDNLLDQFSRIYKLQDAGVSYHNVTSLLYAMHPEFLENLHVSTKTGFQKQGVPQNVVDEIIMATIRANYGQNTEVHKFVGSVSVAGGSGGLWAVQGGNAQVPQRLFEISKATLIKRAVTSVTRQASGLLKIDVKERSDIPAVDRNYTYDIIIVAAPQTEDMKHLISFQGFQNSFEFPGRYHRTVCTMVNGVLKDSYFPNKSPIIDEILTTEDHIFFNSIGRISPVDNTTEKIGSSGVWKIFTKKLLTDAELASIFTEVKETYVKDWLAYPHYDHQPRNDAFLLDTGLYHINAIEWAASAMEMSVIGARNVALLAFDNWPKKKNVSSETETQTSKPLMVEL